LHRSFQHYCDVELRKRPWRISIQTAQLTPLSDVIDSDPRKYQFELPAVPYCLRPLRRDRDTWAVVGRRLRDFGNAPINLLYIAGPEDFGIYDAGFCEALACRLAFELCEAITQSKAKKQMAAEQYKEAVREAG